MIKWKDIMLLLIRDRGIGLVNERLSLKRQKEKKKRKKKKVCCSCGEWGIGIAMGVVRPRST